MLPVQLSGLQIEAANDSPMPLWDTAKTDLWPCRFAGLAVILGTALFQRSA
jgi:hypothetical protein